MLPGVAEDEPRFRVIRSVARLPRRRDVRQPGRSPRPEPARLPWPLLSSRRLT